MRRPGIVAPAGAPTDGNLMLSWKPGAVTCYYDHLQANRLFEYKSQNPAAEIIVRFQHPTYWSTDLEGTAVAFAQQIAAAAPQLRTLNPYISFANELNMYYENGDQNPANQPNYESQQFYQKIGWWVTRTAQIIKDTAPDLKLIVPPFAPGRHEDGSPDDQGNITESFAGYDYLVEGVSTYFNNTLAFHAYWGDINGSHKDRLYDAQVANWYAFRWRRLLKLFATRYNIQANLIVDEVGNFATYDTDFFEQITYFSNQTLADPRVLALTYFIWEDPTFSPGNIFNVWNQYILDLPVFVQRLASQPNVAINPTAANSFSTPTPTPTSLPVSVTTTMPVLSTPSTTSPSTTTTSEFDGPIIRVKLKDERIQLMTIEEYLRAVVPGEVPHSWPAETLKAQAVAARTYAADAIRRARYRKQLYDVVADHTVNQNYDTSKIHPNADAAILATKDLILMHKGNPIQAVFSANCGGHTRNNEDVWTKGSPAPYLRGVSCPNTGEKYGHGVGMCQNGAKEFAQQGRTFEDILHHYYTNVILGKWGFSDPDYDKPKATATTAGDELGGSSKAITIQLETVAGDFPLITGDIGQPNVEITLLAPSGSRATAMSGSKATYGLGGFEFYAPETGEHILQFSGQQFKIPMQGQMVRLTVNQGQVNQVRLVSAIIPQTQASALLETLNTQNGNLFSLEVV